MLDLDGHVLRDTRGREIALTPAEFGLLVAFAHNAGRVLSRDQLLTMVAGREADSFDRSIDVLVGRVRHKTESNPKRPDVILTVPRVGYKFVATLKPPAGPPGAVAAEPVEASESRTIERKPVTALTCEFITKPGQPEPDVEDLYDLIVSSRQKCIDIVTRLGGYMANVLGTGLVAYFGHPQVHEHDAENAVHAGLAIIREIGPSEPGLATILCPRIGIASGSMLFSGDNVDTDQIAIGEPLDSATALRAIAGPGAVVVTAATRRLAGNLFIYRECSQTVPQGAVEARAAWEVVAANAGNKSRFEALYPDNRTRLIARDSEIEQLEESWRLAKTAAGRVVLISGEAGIGKSRLCEAFSERIRDERHIRLHYQCSPHHQSSALHPFVVNIEHAARFAIGDTSDERLDKLETMLTAWTTRSRSDVPLLAALLAIETGDRYPPLAVSPARQWRETLSLLLDQVEAFTREQPLLMIFEDAHWADPTSRELLNLVSERIRKLPALVIITVRPETELPFAGLANVDDIVLKPLDQVATGAMIMELSRGHVMPATTVRQIIMKSGGIPLFVQELTKTLLEAEQLRHTSGHREAVDGRREFVIPDTLQASLHTWLDLLGVAKELAKIAAVIGIEFQHRHIAALTSYDEPALRSALRALVEGGILATVGTPPNATYRFTHALIQEAAQSRLRRKERIRLHGQMAVLLEAEFIDHRAGRPQMLAHHFYEAGVHDKAARYWQMATRQSVGVGDLAGAIVHVNEGLRVLRLLPSTPDRAALEIELQFVLCDLLLAHRSVSAPETQQAWARARDLCAASNRGDLRARALGGLFANHWGLSQLQKAESIAGEMLQDSATSEEPNARMGAYRAMAMTAFSKGEFDVAISHYVIAYDLWRSALPKLANDPTAVDLRGAMTMSGLCYARLITGNPNAARSLVVETVRAARLAHHPYGLALALATECHFHQMLRDPESVLAPAKELEVVSRDCGIAIWSTLAPVFLGWAQIARQPSMTCLDMINQGVDGYRQQGRLQHMPYYLGILADAYRLMQMPAKATEIAMEARALSERTEERWYLPELFRLHGDFLLEQPDPNIMAAAACYDRGMHLARDQGAKLWLVRCRARRARLSGQARGL